MSGRRNRVEVAVAANTVQQVADAVVARLPRDVHIDVIALWRRLGRTAHPVDPNSTPLSCRPLAALLRSTSSPVDRRELRQAHAALTQRSTQPDTRPEAASDAACAALRAQSTGRNSCSSEAVHKVMQASTGVAPQNSAHRTV